MSPASDNSLMEGAMATRVGAEQKCLSQLHISIELRESWQPWHFVGSLTDFTVSNMATWLVGWKILFFFLVGAGVLKDRVHKFQGIL